MVVFSCHELFFTGSGLVETNLSGYIEHVLYVGRHVWSVIPALFFLRAVSVHEEWNAHDGKESTVAENHHRQFSVPGMGCQIYS